MSDLNTPSSAARRYRLPGMFMQVVIASVLGLGLGLIDPALAMQTRWTTDIFLRLIVMAVGPLLFCIVVMGIVGAGSLRTVGRMGIKALVYFEVMTTFALVMAVGIGMLGITGARNRVHANGRGCADGRLLRAECPPAA